MKFKIDEVIYVDEEKKILNTTYLQMVSLTSVMSALGYELQYGCMNFYNIIKNQTISFRSAVEIHNQIQYETLDLVYTGDSADCIQIGVIEANLYEMTKAQGALLISNCKLQLNKKTKDVITQNHNIRFAREEYQEIFFPKEFWSEQ